MKHFKVSFSNGEWRTVEADHYTIASMLLATFNNSGVTANNTESVIHKRKVKGCRSSRKVGRGNVEF